MTPLEQLKEVVKIQTSPGNFDSDLYQYGLANGLLLAEAIMESRSANYLDKPKEWLRDLPKTPMPEAIQSQRS